MSSSGIFKKKPHYSVSDIIDHWTIKKGEGEIAWHIYDDFVEIQTSKPLWGLRLREIDLKRKSVILKRRQYI